MSRQRESYTKLKAMTKTSKNNANSERHQHKKKKRSLSLMNENKYIQHWWAKPTLLMAITSTFDIQHQLHTYCMKNTGSQKYNFLFDKQITNKSEWRPTNTQKVCNEKKHSIFIRKQRTISLVKTLFALRHLLKNVLKSNWFYIFLLCIAVLELFNNFLSRFFFIFVSILFALIQICSFC